MKIGIIIGSVRDGRRGEAVGHWVESIAVEVPGAKWEVIDLKEFDLPLLTSSTNPAKANKQYDDARVTAWSAAIDSCDAFVFVTAEYNHGLPGAFKNAVDHLAPEWTGKTIAFVSYGSVGGVRSVEQWRQVIASLSLTGMRDQITLSTFTDFVDGAVIPATRHDASLAKLLASLVEAAQQ